jgi:hypothetical protein
VRGSNRCTFWFWNLAWRHWGKSAVLRISVQGRIHRYVWRNSFQLVVKRNLLQNSNNFGRHGILGSSHATARLSLPQSSIGGIVPCLSTCRHCRDGHRRDGQLSKHGQANNGHCRGGYCNRASSHCSSRNLARLHSHELRH